MTETVERRDPPLRGGEADTLLAFLDYHRDTLRKKVAGLDRGQLGRTLRPSTMTLGGLVKHLTLVEENWFSVVLEGNPLPEPWGSVKTSRHGGGAFSLRWILLHMLEEYARHNGHADLLRESIDGQVGE
jgi:hypothetical protein